MNENALGLFVLGALGAAAIGIWIRPAWRGLFPRRWATVPAHVVRSYVEGRNQLNGRPLFHGYVEYEYAFGSTRRRGTIALKDCSTERPQVEAVVRQWPVGMAITVQVYRPDPRLSRKDAGDGIAAMAAVAIGAGFMLFSLVMCSRAG